jgi:hypothetical protein
MKPLINRTIFPIYRDLSLNQIQSNLHNYSEIEGTLRKCFTETNPPSQSLNPLNSIVVFKEIVEDALKKELTL